MIGTIISFLGSGVFGSIIGVFGNWLNQRAIRKTKELDNKHELNMAKVQIDILNAKTSAAIKVTQAKVQGAVDLEDSKAYGTTLVVANQKSFSDRWIDKLLDVQGWVRPFALFLAFFIMGPLALVDIIKGFMRPVLTLAFTGAFGYLTYISYSILKQKGFASLTPDQAILYFTLALDTCVMLTTTCVTWWFGDRRMAKSIGRMTEKRLSMNDQVSLVSAQPEPTEEEE